METLKIEGTLTVLSPLHHGGDEKTGTEALLRRMRWIVKDQPTEIPYIEGNAIRGYLRRLLMEDLLSQLDHKLKTPRLYHTLYAGGVLEEVEAEESSKLDINLRRMIRANIPPLSLLGGSIYNQAFAGKLIVGKALPICSELNQYLPVSSNISVYNYLTFTFATRRAERELDVEKPPEPEKKKEEEPTVQMIYNYEVFVPGTKFYHWFSLLDTTPLEKSCFSRMLTLWRERPFIGGRSAIGGGEILLDYPEVFPPKPQPFHYIPDPYLQFLRERKAEIIAVLEKLDAS